MKKENKSKLNMDVAALVDKLMPYWRANNSEENVRELLKIKLSKLWEKGFFAGQEDVLNNFK